METCKNCKWWQTKNDWDYEGIRYDRDPNYERILNKVYAQECKSPKLKFYERPDPDGACVVDGSQYRAELLTGPDFGCVNHEEKP
jgi:hypothetical protein